MKKSFFTVFSLWLLIIIVIFLAGIAFGLHIQTRKTRLFLDKTRAFYLAVSGINIAKALLVRQDNAVDYLGEDWANTIEKEVSYSFPKGKGRLTVNIEDESARLQINDIVDDPEVFERLFENLDVAKGKISYISDYIDTDDDERNFGSEAGSKNADLSVVEELLLLEDITAEDYRKISRFLTTFTDGKININTAYREVLESLRLEFINKFLSVRQEGFFCQEGVESSLQICEDVKKIDYLKDKSDIFRIISIARVGKVEKKITCIIRRQSDTIKTVYWYEK